MDINDVRGLGTIFALAAFSGVIWGAYGSSRKKRFDDELIEYLLALKWWDWDADKIFRNMGALCSGDLQQIKHIMD